MAMKGEEGSPDGAGKGMPKLSFPSQGLEGLRDDQDMCVQHTQ
jgi:hypothetical protein